MTTFTPEPDRLAKQQQYTGILFSDDAIYDGPLLDCLDDSDIPAYVQTMKRLRELPVRVVHGGHDASFGRDRLVKLADQYLGSGLIKVTHSAVDIFVREQAGKRR